MKDKRGVDRVNCKSCDCTEYENSTNGQQCAYCNHCPADHKAVTDGSSFDIGSIRTSTEEVLQDAKACYEEIVTDTVDKNIAENQQHSMDIQQSGPSNCQFVNAMTNQTFEFDLPDFDMYVQPYLNGSATANEIASMRDQLIIQLIEYLNFNELLNNKNNMKQSWGYRNLQKSILAKYPNMIKETSIRKRESKAPLGALMSRLADRRRKQKELLAKRELLKLPTDTLEIVLNKKRYNGGAVKQKPTNTSTIRSPTSSNDTLVVKKSAILTSDRLYEIESFTKLVSDHLKRMPLENSLRCQEKIYSVLIAERIATERNTNNSAIAETINFTSKDPLEESEMSIESPCNDTEISDEDTKDFIVSDFDVDCH